MKLGSALAVGDNAPQITDSLVNQVSAHVPAPDLALLFLHGDLRPNAAEIAEEIRRRLSPRTLLGCTCEGVIGTDRELERQPGAALLAASLPGVELRPFHMPVDRWRALLTDDESLQQLVGTGENHRGQLLLGDPFSTPGNEILEALNRLFPNAPTFGGMASGAAQAGRNALILDGVIETDGAIGVGLGGDLSLHAVVSQGCRPIGDSFVITRSEENWIQELGRRPAFSAVEQMISELADEERALLENGLFVGLVINEYQDQFKRGDFLIRHVMGGNRESNAIAVGELVRTGQTVQFQVRDADTATEDLSLILESQPDEPPAGALLFSCNGRGSRMFPTPHHDVGQLRARYPELPVAGFFAAGEIGPIGGKSFLHGHTASIVLMRPRGPDSEAEAGR